MAMIWNDNTVKFCKFCNINHALTEEFWSKEGKCKKRLAEYSRIYYKNNKEKIAEHTKVYREINKEKVAEYQKIYRESNKEQLAKQKKIYCESNKEKVSKCKKICYENNKEKVAERQRVYCKNNKEKIAECKKICYENNKEKIAERHRIYCKNNKEKIAECKKIYMRKRLKSDPRFKYICTCRRRTCQAYQSRGLKKLDHSIILLGCTPQELKDHLEKQFQPGMTHENHGEWHIDHIKPISSFSDEEIHLAFHYTNLQPLWGEENLKKSDKWDDTVYE